MAELDLESAGWVPSGHGICTSTPGLPFKRPQAPLSTAGNGRDLHTGRVVAIVHFRTGAVPLNWKLFWGVLLVRHFLTIWGTDSGPLIPSPCWRCSCRKV